MYVYIYIYILPCSICFMCVFFLKCIFFLFLSNLYLYNTVLSVLFCVNKDIIMIIIIIIIIINVIAFTMKEKSQLHRSNRFCFFL